MRDFSLIKKNILHYIDNKRISKYEFYQKTGISNGVLSQNNGMSEDNILRFLNYYTDVNTEWLLTGKGEMFKSASVKEYSNSSDEGEINKIEEPAAPYNIRVYDREKELLEQSINDLRSQLNDKERIINMMEKEIGFLKSENEEYAKHTQPSITVSQ